MAAPRQEPRARPATVGPQTGTGAIAGRIVTNDEAATPVRRALVTLSGLEVRHVQLSATDDDGRFVFWGLPAGRFTTSAAKGGYVRQYYGAKRPGVTAGIPVVVGNGQRADIAMTMTRSGAIEGTILLPPGVPSTSLRVQLLRATCLRRPSHDQRGPWLAEPQPAASFCRASATRSRSMSPSPQ